MNWTRVSLLQKLFSFCDLHSYTNNFAFSLGKKTFHPLCAWKHSCNLLLLLLEVALCEVCRGKSNIKTDHIWGGWPQLSGHSGCFSPPLSFLAKMSINYPLSIFAVSNWTGSTEIGLTQVWKCLCCLQGYFSHLDLSRLTIFGPAIKTISGKYLQIIHALQS